jgi:SAM-dependent methyltransferase
MSSEKEIKLNLGCGSNYREGWVNIDINKDLKADYHLDLNKDPLPFEDSTVDYIMLKHVLEHISDLIRFMEECWRVLKPDGVMEIISPYWTHMWSVGDPTHVRLITEGTFGFWDREHIAKIVKSGSHTSQIPGKADFKTIEFRMKLDAEAKRKFKDDPEGLKFAIRHYNNIIHEVLFKLKAVK